MKELVEYWLSLIVRSHNILLAVYVYVYEYEYEWNSEHNTIDTILEHFLIKFILFCSCFFFLRLLFGYFNGNKLFSNSALTQPIHMHTYTTHTRAFSSCSLVLLYELRWCRFAEPGGKQKLSTLHIKEFIWSFVSLTLLWLLLLLLLFILSFPPCIWDAGSFAKKSFALLSILDTCACIIYCIAVRR